MAFTYDAGLRIRPPEPMPECIEGESPQNYFERVLAQCSIESATSAENTSGDSAPTPFNLGQVQHDLDQAQEDINDLEDSDASQQTDIDRLKNNVAMGTSTFESGSTSVTVSLPSEGSWRILGIVPLEEALKDVFVNNVGLTSFTINYTAATAAGAFSWLAMKS